ncbi:MAG: PD40 domain-containing protein [Syntrophaceae bacterium]|nr:PD40 domain-containing protein [Syntrophaceae bacterium]
MRKSNSTKINRFIRLISTFDLRTSIKKAALSCIAIFIFLNVMTFTGGCFAMNKIEKDTISNLSFSHDGKKVVFDRCQNDGCQIQVYNLETGELAAYQSPKNERWMMGKYSYDGKRITFSVIPVKFTGDLDLGEMQIAVMDADGKNYKKVTTGPGAKLYPTFSHNGKKILYACAARIRESGRTPAAQYDAWEIDLTTGKQTQLTFFKYFYMSNLTYFPDDERFIYYGELPDEFEGLRSYPHAEAFKQKMIELGRKGMNIMNVVVMKGKEMIPNPYHFPPKTFAKRPLLSKDGSILLYEKSDSGKFYLYSPEGNHRLVCHAGSVSSAAISPDGEWLTETMGEVIHIFRVKDGEHYRGIVLATVASKNPNWENNVRQKNPQKIKLLPNKPSKIINE